MDRLSPTNPQHLARAYGVAAPARAAIPFPGVTPAARTSPTSGVRTTVAAQVAPSVDRTLAAKARIGTLIAARVSPESPQQMTAGTAPMNTPASGVLAEARPSPALPFYRHPAEKNAVVTSLNAGKVLDVNG